MTLILPWNESLHQTWHATDPNSIDLTTFMTDHLPRAEPDLLRTMLSTFVQALMSAEADAICGAPYGEPATVTPNGSGSRPSPSRMMRPPANCATGSFPAWTSPSTPARSVPVRPGRRVRRVTGRTRAGPSPCGAARLAADRHAAARWSLGLWRPRPLPIKVPCLSRSDHGAQARPGALLPRCCGLRRSSTR